MKRNRQATSSDAQESANLNLIVPLGWEELSDRQLLSVFRLMAMGYPAEELQLLVLLKFSRCKILCRYGTDGWLIRHGRRDYVVKAMQFAEVLPALGWLATVPSMPVRMERWHRWHAAPADLATVPFETFMLVENFYQGYLHTSDDSLLLEIANLLYQRPGSFGRLMGQSRIKVSEGSPHDKAFLISVFYWVASLKEYLAARFPDFFQPVGSNQSANLMRGELPLDQQLADSMNAQIRALTKGDITKEKEIMAMDTWRALTELNAQAREYAELQRSINTHK